MNLKININKKNIFKKGFSLAEAVVVAAIASSFIVVLSYVNTNYLNYAYSQSSLIQANFLAEESLEAMRFLRDKSWSANIASLTPGQDYFLYWNGSTWSATTTTQTPSGFWRTIKVENVYRDSGDNISSSGTLDPGTKLVTASVSWSLKGATTTKQFQTYLANVFNN